LECADYVALGEALNAGACPNLSAIHLAPADAVAREGIVQFIQIVGEGGGSKRLISLKLENMGLDVEAASPLGSVLGKDKWPDLSGFGLNEDDAPPDPAAQERLFSTFERLASENRAMNARRLGLGVHPDSIGKLVAAVQARALPNLTRLALTAHEMTAEDMSSFVAAFNSNVWQTLTKLTLNVRQTMGDAAVLVLAEALAEGTGCGPSREAGPPGVYETAANV
jgi:hypothetical protein